MSLTTATLILSTNTKLFELYDCIKQYKTSVLYNQNCLDGFLIQSIFICWYNNLFNIRYKIIKIKKNNDPSFISDSIKNIIRFLI